jgi:hypothetical protein
MMEVVYNKKAPIKLAELRDYITARGFFVPESASIDLLMLYSRESLRISVKLSRNSTFKIFERERAYFSEDAVFLYTLKLKSALFYQTSSYFSFVMW